MRRIMQMIPVQSDPQGRPLALTWRGRLHLVARVLDDWSDAGAWAQGKLERSYYLVQASPLSEDT